MQLGEQRQAIVDLSRTLVDFGLGMENSILVFRRELVIAALEKWNGNQCKAARSLQVHRNTLGRWMSELHITAAEFKFKKRLRRKMTARIPPAAVQVSAEMTA